MLTTSEELIRAIVEWSQSRPHWERCALRMLARSETIGDREIALLADAAEHQAKGSLTKLDFVALEDFSSDSRATETVQIAGMSELTAVNAIADGSDIGFELAGITLVYGENGSGKSGYARILKAATRSRHKSVILTDVFSQPADPSAKLRVVHDAKPVELFWPSDQPDYLARVSFYDSECATRYVTVDTEVAYRPRAIALLDELAQLAGRVRQKLETRQALARDKTVELPTLPPDSSAAAFVQALSADTTSQELDEASELAADSDSQLIELQQRIANLDSDELEKKRSSLNQLANGLTLVEDRISLGRQVLSETGVAALRDAKSTAVAARRAADAASTALFSSEPVRGIGSESWRILWEAARRFSDEEAYPDQHFPALEDKESPGRCVLCHQELSDQARVRLRAFDEFVTADAERMANEARNTFETLGTELRNYDAYTTEVELALQLVQRAQEDAYAELNAELEILDNRRAKLLEALDSGAIEAEPLPPKAGLAAVRALEATLKTQQADLGAADLSAQLSSLRSRVAEIQGRKTLQASRTLVENRILGLQGVKVLDDAIKLTDTTRLTRAAADFNRSHVGKAMKAQFAREASVLGLRRVRLADAGGRYGNLRHRSQLVDAIQSVPLQDVLSEGEQSALGLAGFLTEVESDTSNSAVIFDDPVTSLDHVNQERVARRIVELAKRRQVVIFSHSIAFALDLKRAAKASSVAVAERYVRRTSSQVGEVVVGGPWAGKTVNQRRNEMEGRIASLKRTYNEGNLEVYEEGVRSWYQDLRLVWELAIEEILLGPVQTRGSLELRPTNLKVLVQFTETDDLELQSAFTRCGDRGSHVPSSQLNRSVPEISDLRAELDTMKEWCARVNAYVNKRV